MLRIQPSTFVSLYLSVIQICIYQSISQLLYLYDGQVQRNKSGRSNTQYLLLVYGQNEICFACPYFILGPMLIFPSPFPFLSVTGRTPSDQPGSFSLVPKSELHALWRHCIGRGAKNKKAELYYSMVETLLSKSLMRARQKCVVGLGESRPSSFSQYLNFYLSNFRLAIQLTLPPPPKPVVYFQVAVKIVKSCDFAKTLKTTHLQIGIKTRQVWYFLRTV